MQHSTSALSALCLPAPLLGGRGRLSLRRPESRWYMTRPTHETPKMSPRASPQSWQAPWTTLSVFLCLLEESPGGLRRHEERRRRRSTPLVRRRERARDSAKTALAWNGFGFCTAAVWLFNISWFIRSHCLVYTGSRHQVRGLGFV